MLRLGLLGGMGWESSAAYYRLANELVREQRGGLHFAECLLYSADFAIIEKMQAEDRWDEAGQLLRRVGLLGAKYTMEQDFYRDRLAANGLSVLTPDVEAAIAYCLNG